MTDWTVTEGDPWSVTFRPMEDDRVIRLHVGNFTIVLPALEAHKLGSALHAASGIDTGERDDGDARDDDIEASRKIANGSRDTPFADGSGGGLW